MWASPDMNSLVDICNNHSIVLIEDAAQSLGAKFKGKKLGTFGKLGSFSFDAGKTLHVGEGGMVITDDKESSIPSEVLNTGTIVTRSLSSWYSI